MKNYIWILLFHFLILQLTYPSFSQFAIRSNKDIENLDVFKGFDFLANPDIIILLPIDSLINEPPVLTIMPENEVTNMVCELFEKSYMHQSARLYNLCQNYLITVNKIKTPEPVYLLLSQNQGGFPQSGFYLKQGDSIIDKTKVPYIELVKNNPDSEDYLGSMTQIYPHEMGHVLYHMLSEDSDSIVPGSVDVHYVSLITDIRTAFNEGFAMHFENMAREFDPDTARMRIINEDFNEKSEAVKPKVKSYVRDFKWPFRIDYYRTTMVFWYQNFEDIKRYDWVKTGKIKYRNISHSFSNPEKSLFYRNSGIDIDTILRNPQQMFSTEGVIASFFFKLMQSDLKDKYPDTTLINMFLPISLNSNEEIKQVLNPFENQYIKIFYVLNKHVNFSLTEKSQFIDFVNGYCHEFPEEANTIRKIFEETTGYPFDIDSGNELWIINSDYQHGILVMDQFGGIVLPLYCFNLNASDKSDLKTFPEISDADADLIVNHINENGPLVSYVDLNLIEGISEQTINLLLENKFSPEVFKQLEEGNITLSIKNLIYSNVSHLLLRALFYCLISIFLSLLAYRYTVHKKPGIKKAILYFAKFFLFFLVGFACIIVTNYPTIYFLSSSLFIVLIGYLLYRRKEQNISVTLSSIIMIALILYSVL